MRNLRYTYAGWPETLAGVDLAVARGEIGFLLGPSGSGKTTILRCIAGLETTYDGEIAFEGARLDGLAPRERGVGLLLQEPALFPHLDVAGNVAFGLRYRGVARRDEPAEAARWLDLVGLRDKARARVDQLSGGQRQRVALARTLAAKPRVVLLDEPLSALDRALRDELGARIRDLLRESRVAALWVTHDEDEARRWGDKAWRLVEGSAVPEPARPS